MIKFFKSTKGKVITFIVGVFAIIVLGNLLDLFP